MTQAEMRRLFAAAQVVHLATAGRDGQPHVVPICCILSGEAVYFAVDEKPKRTRDLKRLRNLAENPRVAVLADHYEDDWTRLWWIRIDGRAAIAGGDDSRLALAALASKYPQYRIQPPRGSVVRIEAERWSGWRPSA